LDFNKFEDVNCGLAMLTLYFTFSRTECPCPKAYTGPGCFEPESHWQARDFKLRGSAAAGWVLWVRFKGYKQDPRAQRTEASHAAEFLPFDPAIDGPRMSHDWVPIGDVPEVPDFSIARWYMQFIQLLGRTRDPEEPMFLSRDKVRPYTYSALRSDMYYQLVAIGGDTTLGPHGIRVLAYNLSRRGNGLELTVVHGGWKSGAHSRYARFDQASVLSIAAGMLGVSSQFASSAPRVISSARTQRHSAPIPQDFSDSDSDDPSPSSPAARPARPARAAPHSCPGAPRSAVRAGNIFPSRPVPASSSDANRGLTELSDFVTDFALCSTRKPPAVRQPKP
jgi:hypothetical protein